MNRVLIGAAVAGTGLLTDVAAHAFPGHKRQATASAATATRAAPARSSAGATRHHRGHHARPRTRVPLLPPAQAPTQATATAPPATATAPPATATTPPATTSPAPAPQPAPAPTVSGGS